MDAQLITASEARRKTEKNAPNATEERIKSKLQRIDSAISYASDHGSFEASYIFMESELEIVPDIVENLESRGFKIKTIKHTYHLGCKIKIYW